MTDAHPRFGSEAYGEGYWERAEGSNYRNYADDPGWQAILRVFAAREMRNLRIIEAACAKGYFVMHARARGHLAYGFDISGYAVANAAKKAKAFVQVHDAIEPWPYKPGSADIVCSWEFFEHIAEEDEQAVLDQMVATLKPGGELWLKIGIVVPGDHPFAGQEDHDHTHCNVKTREQWEALFAAAGLEHVKDAEDDLDSMFAKRDWLGRFFVWRKPE
jgi:predicted SAM-dependent methyltransferase